MKELAWDAAVWALYLWAAAVSAFSLLAAWRVATKSGAESNRPDLRRVLVLRPVDEPSAFEIANLEAGEQHAWRQMVLSPRPIPGVSWQASDPQTENRKVGHVSAALERASVRFEASHVLVVDADVLLNVELVSALVAAHDAGAELAYAAPSVSGAVSVGGAAWRGVLGSTAHDFRVLAAMHVGASSVCGKAVCLGDEAQRLWPTLATYAAEDLELSRRLWIDKKQVVQVSVPAPMIVASNLSWAAARARLARWFIVLAAHRPILRWTIPFFITPLPFFAVWCFITPMAAALVLFSQCLLCAVLRGKLVEALLGQFLILDAWFAVLGRRHIFWRGRRLRVLCGGRMYSERGT